MFGPIPLHPRSSGPRPTCGAIFGGSSAAATSRDLEPERPSGNVLPFTGVRYGRAEPEPAVYEDPRWADRHKPE